MNILQEENHIKTYEQNTLLPLLCFRFWQVDACIMLLRHVIEQKNEEFEVLSDASAVVVSEYAEVEPINITVRRRANCVTH